jgi:mevalonate kinase
MALHATNLAVEVGAKGRATQIVARRLETEGRIERDRAREIVAGCASGCGKAILLGEHAVVYGQPAIAVPAPGSRTWVSIVDGPEPGVAHADGVGVVRAGRIFARAGELLGVEGVDRLEVRIEGDLPIGVGMGSSAALGVAFLRALAGRDGRDLDLEKLREMATDLERISHGNPSGIDPAVVVSERPIFFRKGEPIEWLEVPGVLPLLAADTGTGRDTAEVVAAVARLRAEDPAGVDALFEEIGRIVGAGRTAIEAGDLDSLGALMAANQECLRTLTVSSEPAERLIEVARAAGALGAKVSGAGRGGIVVVLARPGEVSSVRSALLAGGAAGVHRFEETR